MSPRGIKPDLGFFYEKEKQESIQIQGSAPDGEIIINQDPEGDISTMMVVILSYKVEGLVDNIDNPLCG